MKLLIVLLALTAYPALADVIKGGRTIECFCTDSSGARVDLGNSVCLYVDGRAFMARCEMSLNVPMWREIADPCVSSSLGETFQNLDPAADPGAVDAQI